MPRQGITVAAYNLGCFAGSIPTIWIGNILGRRKAMNGTDTHDKRTEENSLATTQDITDPDRGDRACETSLGSVSMGETH
jgi:hypothetical protein